ncbi:MAG: histidine--tRNA ligase [Porphyromonadaceae bacterium]|nr:MAG: histidine--tRNA ligase [Porphyromonadaceae bacterium]
MNQKPSIPKGTRDFGPVPMMRRNYLFNTIRSVFQLYGYLPIETPAMETLDTLMGKYGEEGDKLVFNILNSGDFASGINTELLQKLIQDPDNSALVSRTMTSQVSEKALRYDLTVPFARFVVQHRDEISFPFKRYQIQPVWRADRPQKGRYREFYQCDVDVIGSDSLLNEAELIKIIDDVFSKLGLNIVIKINNRKILAGLAEASGLGDNLTDFTVALDKLDKIGIEHVSKEWISKGISGESIIKLTPIIGHMGSNTDKISGLKDFLKSSTAGMKGLEEVETLLTIINRFNLNSSVEIDLTLARGLNYYTGAIIEVKSLDIHIGSICGGGRYDDLTGIFGMPGVSGVGVSFGADRIYDVMEQINGFPALAQSGTQVLFLNFGFDEATVCQPLAGQIRAAGIRCELYPDPLKIKKQLQYADQNHIPIVVMIGETERNAGKAAVKIMSSGEQINVAFPDLTSEIRKII